MDLASYQFPSFQKDTRAVLLVTFSWCPKGGVGARRWSKLAKYLSRAGVEIDVVCTKYPYKDTINWCHEVEGVPNIRAHRTATGYPAYLLRPRRNFLIKLGSRIWKRWSHPLDVAQQWPKRALPVIKQLLQEKPALKTVVITCPSFSILTLAPQIKAIRPDVELILDFRDPWHVFLPKNQDSKAYRQAFAIEKKALTAADQLWVTTPEFARFYANKHPTVQGKLWHLPNGYDAEDFQQLEIASFQNLKAIYPGLLTPRRLPVLLMLLNAIDQCQSEALKAGFRIDLFAENNVFLNKLSTVEQNLFAKYVRLNQPVLPTEVPDLINGVRYGVSVYNPGNQMIAATKEYEYLALQRQIIGIGSSKTHADELSKQGHYYADPKPEEVARLVEQMSHEIELFNGQTIDNSPFTKYEIGNMARRLLSAP